MSANGKAVKPVRHADGAFVENLFDVIEDWDVSASALQPGAPEEERVKVEILAPLVGRDVLAVGEQKKQDKAFDDTQADSALFLLVQERITKYVAYQRANQAPR